MDLRKKKIPKPSLPPVPNSSSYFPSIIPSSGPKSTRQNDALHKLQNDMSILNKKLSALQNQISTLDVENKINPPLFSGKSQHHSQNDEQTRFALTDSILSKMMELDREVLRKTSEGIPALARRNSGCGSDMGDLSLLPTHLRIVDRLLDFHQQLKRELTRYEEAPERAQSPSLQQLNSRINSLSTENEKLRLILQQHDVNRQQDSHQAMKRISDLESLLKRKCSECEECQISLKMAQSSLELSQSQQKTVLERVSTVTKDLSVAGLTSPKKKRNSISTTSISLLLGNNSTTDLPHGMVTII
jgi:hypothetical protein